MITSGLEVWLNAGNPSSYPGTGTLWSDLTSNGRNATLVGGPTYSSVDFKSIQFITNVSQYAEVASTGSLASETFTFNCFLKLRTYAGTGYLVAKAIDGSYGSYWFRVGFGGAAELGIGTNTTSYQVLGSVLALDTWYYLTGTYSGNVGRIYIDGVFAGSVSTSNTIKFNSSNILLANYSLAFPNLGSNSYIHDFTYYNRVLSDDEILYNYNYLTNPNNSNFFQFF